MVNPRPYRLSLDQSGNRFATRIPERRPLSFTFDGKSYQGYQGDNLASALMANGVRLMGRSFKYHRPRSVVGLGADEPNALAVIGEGDKQEPNLRMNQVELYDGLVAQSQNRWPSLDFDIGAINQLYSRMLPSGFYYKTFMGPTKSAWMWFEPFIRQSAGLGPAIKEADPDHYEQIHHHTDVMIIGGGVAGIAAALVASQAGAKVMLVDENPEFGGVSDLYEDEIDEEGAASWIKSSLDTLKSRENVILLNRTIGAGLYHHKYSLLLERVTDHDPSKFGKMAVRNRLWKVRPKEIILATGALERPLTFVDNDRPGVMLSSAVRGYAQRYGIIAGEKIAIFTNNDEGYRTANTLHGAGVNITGVIDIRKNPESEEISKAQEAGLPLFHGYGVSEVKSKNGGKTITKIRASQIRGSGRLGSSEMIEADALAMSGGFNPVVHLHCHNGGKLDFDHERQLFIPKKDHPDNIITIGAARGVFDLNTILNDGYDAGEEVVKRIGLSSSKTSRPLANSSKEAPASAMWFIPAIGAKNEGDKHFLDYQNDVVASGVELANREGYQSVEHVKRYTTLGMATDQGKTSNISALGILADAQGKTIPQIGTTTFRPPYTPISIGALSGQHKGDLFVPVRRTSVQDWHDAHNAFYEPVGLWRRPFCYINEGESREDAINREVMAVRENVGMLDASTLGKIEVNGSDAGKFLDLMYTNMMSTLKPGKARYGLIMNENGFLIDDGVVVRLNEDRYLVHTTSGGADSIASWFELWHQTEWPELKIFITPVTEQWAQFAVVGQKARHVLESLESDIDFGKDEFPFMEYREGKLDGLPVRVFRISFSGELSYEIATPAKNGAQLWDTLLKAGKNFDLTPYGTEAMHVLRAEKGFIIVGDETDGVTTPVDLGLSWALSKKKTDYVGKQSLTREHLMRSDRPVLVGLETIEPNDKLPDGAYAVKEVKEKGPMDQIGFVTSSYYSPTLKRSIALGMIKEGQSRMGDILNFPLEDKVMKAKIVDPVFFDKEGSRQNV